jgi:WhiB family redox-sensing transcriptional regulator
VSPFSRQHLSLVADPYAGLVEVEERPAPGWDAPVWDAPAWDAADAPTDESWRRAALCAETDPEAFFPEKGGSTREAKRVCAGCPVRMQCLEYALGNDERFGIWGGLSERERRRIRLQRRTPLSA